MASEKNEPTGVDVEEYRKLVCQIAGVHFANFVLDDNGVVEELHILADSSRHPKQIVRDIQSAMMARFSLDIDHRVISVAQIASDQLEDAKPTSRLTCSEIAVSHRLNLCQISVILSDGENEFTGSSSGPANTYSKSWMLAQATIDAIHNLIGGGQFFTVLEVRNVPVLDSQALLVCVSLQNGADTEVLIGCAMERGDASMAVVKATLDAINRRLRLFLN